MCLKINTIPLYSIDDISETISFDFSKMKPHKIYFFKIFSSYLGVTGILVPYNSTEWRAATFYNNQGLILILNNVKNTLSFFGDVGRLVKIEIYENII